MFPLRNFVPKGLFLTCNADKNSKDGLSNGHSGEALAVLVHLAVLVL